MMQNTDYTLEEIILLKEENESLKTKIHYLETMLAEKNSRGAGRKNISLEIQEEIFQKSQKGVKVKELSDIYGLSTATIYSIMRKYDSKQSKAQEPQIEFLDDTSLKSDGENIFDYLNSDFFA